MMDEGDSSLVSQSSIIYSLDQALSRGLTLARCFLRRVLLAFAATDAARLLILAAAGAEEDRALMFYAERVAAKSVRRKG